jgi:tRNA G46 methylase TrmB
VHNSRIISSNQTGIHQQLESVVRRHLHTRFRRPYTDHSLRVFEQINKIVSAHTGALILDSFCGVGESTRQLAHDNPEALVIGIDKSSHRLDKHAAHYRQPDIENYQLVRADADDFWRLAVDAGWRLDQHFLFYPNPWPKARQLKRRCHGSPLFPTLLKLGGRLELRSNWPLYVEEFAHALSFAGYSAEASPCQTTTAITPFERKYLNSGHALWRCVCKLD